MVKRAALVSVALASTAVAEPPMQLASPPSDLAPYTRLGTRIGIAQLPFGTTELLSYSLGLSVDHHLGDHLRGLVEYEYAWLGPLDGAEVGVAGLPASGHRLQLGVRHHLVVRGVTPMVQLFLDGDVGIGASMIDDPMRGAVTPVHAFAGVHAGMSLVQADRKAIWDYDLLLRVQMQADGVGGFFGVGMSWGN